MTSKRLTGSYYTPIHIADFIVNRVLKKFRGDGNIKVLEPSAGDGVFVQALYKVDSFNKSIEDFIAIELSLDECNKIKEKHQEISLTVKCADFLSYQNTFSGREFDIIVGNPPYIKKNLLTKDQINLCQEIHSKFDCLSKSSIKNIWSAFLLRSIELINDNGILAFVLPAELLQVNFTSELRKLLVSEFQRIEIFTFNELVFKECKGQDTLIIIAEKLSENPGLFFHNFLDLDKLKNSDFDFVKMQHNDGYKWTLHCLLKTEIDLLDRLKSNLKTISYYCTSKAGIVTGANDYFVLNKEDVIKFNLQPYAKPIVKKNSFVRSWLTFNETNFNELVQENLPCYLINLNNVDVNKKKGISTFLSHGLAKNVNKRYKTGLRNNWYEVPNIGFPADAIFSKRCHEAPKFVVNEAGVLATDGAYLVFARDGIDIHDLVVSFYNTLSLIFSELHGRFYGGGVLEITPNEFKRIPLPYTRISDENKLEILKNFSTYNNIDELIKKVDDLVLKSVFPDMLDSEYEMLLGIRRKLISRRKRL